MTSASPLRLVPSTTAPVETSTTPVEASRTTPGWTSAPVALDALICWLLPPPEGPCGPLHRLIRTGSKLNLEGLVNTFTNSVGQCRPQEANRTRRLVAGLGATRRCRP